MEKRDSLFQQQKRWKLKNERWKPYIRYEKETDSWTIKTIRIDEEGNGRMEEDHQKASSTVEVVMDKEELDVISRIVAYLYHDKKDEYKEIASDLRKEHIYKDLRSIDQWLNIQYQKIEAQDEKYKKLNELDMEIINELPK